MPQRSSEVLQAVRRASKRSSAVVHEEMKQGLYSLATITSLAPWVGLFGTILGILNSFRGISGERTATMAAIFESLSESLWSTAFGLLVGVTALWCYRYLEDRLQTFDHEMEGASLELLNQLSRFPGRFTSRPAINRLSDGLMFGEKSLAELSRDEKSLRRSMFLAGTALVVAWCVQAARYFFYDSLPLYSTARAACVRVLFTFAVSCLPVYPVWIKLLRRRPGGLAVLASIFCLCWSIAELVLGVHLQ
jgi:hypothetical protein